MLFVTQEFFFYYNKLKKPVGHKKQAATTYIKHKQVIIKMPNIFKFELFSDGSSFISKKQLLFD